MRFMNFLQVYLCAVYWMKPAMIRLVDVYGAPDAPEFLYRLLAERRPEESIAHGEMPGFEGHCAFIAGRPYRAWYLIEAALGEKSERVGACTLRADNELGVFILRAFQRRGYAREALQALMRMHEPLPAVPMVRSGRFVAKVNPANQASVALFTSLGARHISNLYEF
jgi:RimJ/RimL family protein N-acetyltransferase